MSGRIGYWVIQSDHQLSPGSKEVAEQKIVTSQEERAWDKLEDLMKDPTCTNIRIAKPRRAENG